MVYRETAIHADNCRERTQGTQKGKVFALFEFFCGWKDLFLTAKYTKHAKPKTVEPPGNQVTKRRPLVAALEPDAGGSAFQIAAFFVD
jgi:hypothetical protein